MLTRHRGKISQLPKALREELNLLIEGNTESKTIIPLLAERGHPGITQRNLTCWIRGGHRNKGPSGYDDWRQGKKAIEDLQAQQEFSLELLRQNEGHEIHDAARLLAASQLAQVIKDFDVQQLKDALNAQPENYARVVNALAKLSRDNLEYEKYRFLVAEQKRKIEAHLAGQKRGGLSTATLLKIEQELHLL